MDICNKSNMTPQERRQKDDMRAAIEKLAADQGYIAMMADIELESEENEEMTESEGE